MRSELSEKIVNLKLDVASENYSLDGISEWGGADVMIRSQMDSNAEEWTQDQPMVVSLQSSEPRRRVVVTEHSIQLSWLFNQLRDAFEDKVDYVSKYDFYGSLAQAAIDYIAQRKDKPDVKELLYAVLDAAERFAEDES